MGEPVDSMRSIARAAEIMSHLPGVDGERITDEAANRMRKVLSESLAEVSDDIDQIEVYESMRDIESRVLRESRDDTEGLSDGQVRMRCQIALVERMMEETQ